MSTVFPTDRNIRPLTVLDAGSSVPDRISLYIWRINENDLPGIDGVAGIDLPRAIARSA